MRSTPIFLLFGAALLHCAALTPYTEHVCGNRVVDPGEDCDGTNDPRCVSCRLRCDVKVDGGTEPLACPSSKDEGFGAGWGCGTDGLCRQKSGNFALATVPVSSNVYTLKSGDFDSDRRADIVGSPPYGSVGASRVHYFDGKGALSSITSLDLSISIPIVADLDHKGGDDIGFSVRNLPGGAFGAVSGQTDRTFSTIVFPTLPFPQTDARIAIVNASSTLGIRMPAGLPGCAVGLRHGADPSKNPVQVTDTFTALCPAAPAEGEDPGVLGGKPTFAITDVIGSPKAGRILGKGDGKYSACGQVIFRTAKSLEILSPCTPGLVGDQKVFWRPDAPLVSVPLNGALAEDIYVGPVDNFDEDEILVHYGTPGDPNSSKFYKLDRVAMQLVPDTRFTGPTGLPLTSGNLDGDGKPDFVLATAIKLSGPDPLQVIDAGPAYTPPDQVEKWTEILPRDQLRWTEARIGRFNNDDLPDVLVSFTNSLDVDVMSNAGNGRFTSFTVRSEQIVRGLASGDFDGDRIEDVAFFQSPTTLDTGDEATLTLAFGSATGGPEAPRTAGKFRYPVSFGGIHSRDGTDNLAVLQITPIKDQLPNSSVSVLFGNGGRQQVAPLFLLDPDDDAKRANRHWEPVSFNVGIFPAPAGAPAPKTDDPKAKSIIAIATGYLVHPDPNGGSGDIPYDFRTQPWVATPDSSVVGGLDPFLQVGKELTLLTGLDQDAFQKGKRQLRLITAKGNIDNSADDSDELVNIAPTPGQSSVNVLSVHTATPNDGVLITQIADAHVDEGDPIELFDLDRDGFLDLVYIITIGNKRVLSVLRGDGKGSFISPPLTTAGTALEGALGFATLDTGAATKSAVVTDHQLWLVELGKDQQLHLTNSSFVLGSTTTGISGVTAGDFNGDGVPDLAIAQAGGIRIILQKPVNE